MYIKIYLLQLFLSQGSFCSLYAIPQSSFLLTAKAGLNVSLLSSLMQDFSYHTFSMEELMKS